MDLATFKEAFDAIEIINLLPSLVIAAGGLICILSFASRLSNIDQTTPDGVKKANSYKTVILVGIFQCVLIAPIILFIANPSLMQAVGINL